MSLELRNDLHSSCDDLDVDYLVFPVIDWDYRFQRPQHLCSKLAEHGHRVLYFRTTLVAEHCVCEPTIVPVREGIYVAELPGGLRPPDIYRDVPTCEQVDAISEGVVRCCQALRLRSTVSLVNYPFWQPIVERLSNTLVVYDCMDDHTSFPNAGRPARELEELMMRQAEVFVCSSLHLLERARKKTGRVGKLIRNAVDPEHYSRPPAALRLQPDGRTVGYIGAMGNWTDIDLLAQCARELPDLRFVFVGSTLNSDVSDLASLPNTLMVGEVPYADLPSYVHAFDVCLIPYLIGDYALASDPVKVWEYLAAGKPVVAIRFPEIEHLSNHITLASSPSEFVAGIRQAIENDSEQESRVRMDLARENTWSHRCERLRHLVRRRLPRISVLIATQDRFNSLRATLDSLWCLSDYPDLEIVLVDNESHDETEEFLSSWFPDRFLNVRTFRNPTRQVKSAALNQAARAATGDYFAFVDVGTYLTSGWALDLVKHFWRDPQLGLLTSATNSPGSSARIDIEYPDIEQMLVCARRHTRTRRGQRIPLDAMPSHLVMMPRAVWERTGELDEDYSCCFFLEDYSSRVRELGYDQACAQDVFIHYEHVQNICFPVSNPGQPACRKNRDRFESKHGPWLARVPNSR